MIFVGMIIEGEEAGQYFESPVQFATHHRTHERLTYLKVFGVWIIDRPNEGVIAKTQRAVDILLDRAHLELAFKAGFDAASDYENINAISEDDHKALKERHWQEFRS